MDLFLVDTTGEENLLFKDRLEESFEPLAPLAAEFEESTDEDESELGANNISDEDADDGCDYGGLPPPSIDIIEILKNPVLYPTPLWTDPKDTRKETKPSGLENFCKAMGWTWKEGELPTKIHKNRSKKQAIDNEPIHAGHGKTDIAKEMKSCVLKGIEKKESVEKLTDKKAAKLRKIEKDKTKGKDWFNMPATEVTDELRQDMEIIQMRSVLNPTHFYKKNDLKTLPKYFQVGTVLPSPLEKHNERGARPTKKKSLVDELLADAEFQQYNKRKYSEVMAEKSKTGYKKAYKKMKKLKKGS